MMCVKLWGQEWLDEFWRVDEEGKVALLLEKGVDGIRDRECGRMFIGRWWQRRKQLLYG